MTATQTETIQAGTPATLAFGSDRYPAEVVSATAKTVYVQHLEVMVLDAEAGTFVTGEREGGVLCYTLRRNGRWVMKGEPIHTGARLYIGKASYYRDPSF